MQRVLNAVNHMISNVEYVYPGSQCEENTFAYVRLDPFSTSERMPL